MTLSYPLKVFVLAAVAVTAFEGSAAAKGRIKFRPTARDVAVLMDIHGIHDRANDAITILSWTILHEFLAALPEVGKPKKEAIAKLSGHIISIDDGDWDSFDRTIGAITHLKRIELLEVTGLCRERCSEYTSGPGREFWGKLLKRYSKLANRLPR